MHARLNGRAVLAALVLVAGSTVTTMTGAPTAMATTTATTGQNNCVSGGSGGTSGGGSGGGSIAGNTVTMWQMLTLTSQRVLCQNGTNSGSGSGSGTNYQPPQCWWGPEYSPTELQSAIGALETSGGSADGEYTALNGEYAAGGSGATPPATYKSTDGPPWDYYNVGASPGGMWWGLILNENITTAGLDACTAIFNKHFPEDWYWVADANPVAPEPGDVPTIDPYQLALYVQGKVQLNPLPVHTNPDLTSTKATVGLPTWVWADAAETTVNATICTAPKYGSICVTMKAEAQSFTLTTNDPGATVYAHCDRDANGVIGTPYTSGQSGNPPCGVTFSQPGQWQLTMQTTWNVTINYGAGTLTGIGYSATDVSANVQEVQAINN